MLKKVPLEIIMLIVVVSLIIIMLLTTILVGENGLINQWKSEANNNNTEYVIKTNEAQ